MAARSSRDLSDCTARRRAVGGELKQHGIVGREDAVVHRADVKHAGHRAVDKQRHADQGLDSFFQQDRIEHVGVIDVVQDDRPRLGGDAARETPGRPGCARPALTPPPGRSLQ